MAYGSRSTAVGWLVATGLIGSALVAPMVLATPPAPDHKVTICHRTNSNTNPYLVITVDIAAAGHLRGGHDTQHLGPIWDETLKARKVEWGDIIPPYTYGTFTYPGLNWTSEGRVIWGNGCRIPAPTSSPATTPAGSSTPSASLVPSATPSSGASSSPAGSVEGATGTPDGQYEGIAGTPPPTDALTGPRSPSGQDLHLLALTLAGLLGATLLTTPRRAPRAVTRPPGGPPASTRTPGDGEHRQRPERARSGRVRDGASLTEVLDWSCSPADHWATVAVPERDSGRGAQPAAPRPP